MMKFSKFPMTSNDESKEVAPFLRSDCGFSDAANDACIICLTPNIWLCTLLRTIVLLLIVEAWRIWAFEYPDAHRYQSNSHVTVNEHENNFYVKATLFSHWLDWPMGHVTAENESEHIEIVFLLSNSYMDQEMPKFFMPQLLIKELCSGPGSNDIHKKICFKKLV